MSPRAAWRLESIGFARVYDHVAGKWSWSCSPWWSCAGGRRVTAASAPREEGCLDCRPGRSRLRFC